MRYKFISCPFDGSFMTVLICKNIKTEGPGTIEDYLKRENIAYKIVDLSMNESVPDPDSFDTLIVMGGPMSANEEEIYPYLKEEEKLVRKFISQDKKVLGICLGAQIMAKALGAKVYCGSEKEIGWYDIELTDEGLRDRCMKNLARDPETEKISKKFKVFHWHGETFTIPEYAVRIAGSELYPNQAFKYRENAYAFQFHIEVSKEMIYDWFRNNTQKINSLKSETEKLYDVYHRRAVKFYKVFFN
ncbi:MAG: type 1 glutamine amidotransferase [Thermodesulfovibrionia bacterium]|nr:type 1 glutamine amidotransferase [Thermodesulfovibrionia bacterium]